MKGRKMSGLNCEGARCREDQGSGSTGRHFGRRVFERDQWMRLLPVDPVHGSLPWNAAHGHHMNAKPVCRW